MIYKRKALIDEINALEKENQDLLASIKRIDDKEHFETIKHFTYLYHNAMYRKIPFEFIETVFYTYKKTLLKHANGCFIDKILDVACDAARRYKMDELVMNIPMYCNNVIKTGKGTVFILTDPYRTIATKPMKNISDESAKICKGRMLVVKIVIPENHRAVKSFEIKGYRLLKMNLTNILGKDPPETNKLFTQYKNIKDENEAIKAIDSIENHYNKYNDCKTLRQIEKSLRILTDKMLIGISYENNQLWYADEPSGQLLVYQSMAGLNDDEKQDDSKYCFFFINENFLPT